MSAPIVNPPGSSADSVNSSSNTNPKASASATDNSNSQIERPYAPNALVNGLEKFASYNYIFTLSCLTHYEVDNPEETYRKKEPEVIMLRSGGGLGNKKTTLAYETENRYEFFIDNLEIMSIIGPNVKTKQTNATMISFDIVEPYSMGTFLQLIQVAAYQAGYEVNYLQANYLLTIDFVGWDIDGKKVPNEEFRRLIPLKINKMDFKVTEGGSKYEVTGHPWHEQCFNDQVQALKSDIKIEGKTVLEMCQTGIQSIATHFNGREKEKQNKKEVITPDQYAIIFPSEDGNTRLTAKTMLSGGEGGGSATLDVDRLYKSGKGSSITESDSDAEAEIGKVTGVNNIVGDEGSKIKQYAENEANVSEIGKAKLVNDYLSGKKQPFGRPKFVEREDNEGFFERGKIQADPNGTTITFPSGTLIQDMIEEIILLSDYGIKIADATTDSNGMIPWFRIDSHVYVIKDKKQQAFGGRDPRIYVYVVVPYKAHISNYAPVTDAFAGYKNLALTAQKEFNYIYTGKNDDVINFDIKFDTAFFQAITPFGGLKTATHKLEQTQKPYGETVPVPEQKNISGTGNAPAVGSQTQEEVYMQDSVGGTVPGEDYKVAIARNINNALTNSNADLVLATMTIWGDPYFLADSGLGNYSAQASSTSINITADGTMDWERSEVDILINFKTPIDFNADGNYDFGTNGAEALVPAFSGLYRVNMVTSRFSDGLFTQDLKLIRRKNQIGYDLPSSAPESDPYTAVEQGPIANDSRAIFNKFPPGVNSKIPPLEILL